MNLKQCEFTGTFKEKFWFVVIQKCCHHDNLT